MGSTLDERRRRRANISSMAFFVLAGLLIIAGVVYYFRDQHSNSAPPPPTNPPGRHSSIDVVERLKQAGIKDVSYEKRSVQSPVLSPPGQPLKVNGAVLYLFIYDSPATREHESANLDPSAVLPASEATADTDATPHIVSGSNVLAILVGGGQSLQNKIDSVIEGLT